MYTQNAFAYTFGQKKNEKIRGFLMFCVHKVCVEPILFNLSKSNILTKFLMMLVLPLIDTL